MGALGYTLLFRIVCRHTYFSDERAQVLSVQPTPACQALLKRYQLLFRPFVGGGAVYYNEGTPLAQNTLAQFNERLPFSFMLLNHDPYLIHYTDLDLTRAGDPAATIFQFDNAADFPAASTIEDEGVVRQTQTLHPLGAPFNQRPLPIWSRHSLYSPPAASLSASAFLTVREKLTQQIVWQETLSQTSSKISLNLSSLPEGCYFLQIDQQTIEHFYLSDIPPVQQWGRVDIYAGGAYQASYLPQACAVLDERSQPAVKTFTLMLNNRKTIWRYYLLHGMAEEQKFINYEMVALPKQGSLFEKTLATDQSQEIRFTRLPTPEQVNDQLAWVFESDQALPLWQTPAEQLTVLLRPERNKTRNGRTFTLPYPTPNAVKLDGSTPRQVYSEIFVYL